MATCPMSQLVSRLHGMAISHDLGMRTDGQLLKDYLSRREPAALAALVKRHGPMVWRVCRSLLGNYHDAEDAFQAAFLVFVRRASSISTPNLLANWLYGVARQTALKARATAAKRHNREQQLPQLPEPGTTEQTRHDDRTDLLERELALLPENYRVVILLCDLQGKSRKEAAACLGWPEGTVSGRLARARVLLGKRMSRRGIVLVGAPAFALSPQAASAAPSALLSNTIHAACLFANGNPAAITIFGANVIALTQGVLRMMLLFKLKNAALILLLWVLVAAVFAGLAFGGRAMNPVDLQEQEASTPVPTEKAATVSPPGTTEKGKDVTLPLSDPVHQMRWSRDRSLMASLTTRKDKVDGKDVVFRNFRFWNAKTGALKLNMGELECPGFMNFDLSADGKLLAVSRRERIEEGDKLELYDTKTGDLLRTIDVDYARSRLWFSLAPDNNTVAVCGCDLKNDKGILRTQGTIRIYDVKKGKFLRKFVSGGHEIISIAHSHDGKRIAAGSIQGEITVWDIATGKVVGAIQDSGALAGLAFSPDGKLSTCAGSASPVLVWDLAAGKKSEMAGPPARINDVAFSLDGRFLAGEGYLEKEGKWLHVVRVWSVSNGEQLLERVSAGKGSAFTTDNAGVAILRDEKTLEVVNIDHRDK